MPATQKFGLPQRPSSHEDEARKWFATRGLTPDVIAQIATYAESERAACTSLDPSGLPGTMFWAKGNTALAEFVLPHRWSREEEKNVPIVTSPCGTRAVTFAVGNAATGHRLEIPSTKNPRGRATESAVARNQLYLFDSPPEPAPAESRQSRWMLLAYRDVHELRVELSLPLRMEQSRIVDWSTRVFYPAVRLPELDHAPPLDDFEHDFDVDLR